MSHTSKRSKPSEKESEYLAPSLYEPGRRITVVNSDQTEMIQGRIVSRSPGVGCHIRPMTPEGIPMARDIVLVLDREYKTIWVES